MIAEPFNFQISDPARTHFQYLEDLATAYWYSEVLFAALELKLFDSIEKHAADTDTIAQISGWRPAPLSRLLNVLADTQLVRSVDGQWHNSQIARTYLRSDQPGYMGDALLYRRYLQSKWQGLADQIAPQKDIITTRLGPEDSYQQRNFHYVRAMDQLAGRKSKEIIALLNTEKWSPPVLDIGGGAGALSRRLMQPSSEGTAILFDLPEVLEAARALYPQPDAWHRVQPVAGDFRFDTPFSGDNLFGLIVMSNFLHAYGPHDARRMLAQACALLKPGGMILIHDYFPDRIDGRPPKGHLHHLNMGLNTLEGYCHHAKWVAAQLRACGLNQIRIQELPSDSSIIMAADETVTFKTHDLQNDIATQALQIGFRQALPLTAAQVAVASWVRIKCRYGCENFGQSLLCPPGGKTDAETSALLKEYSRALIVEGEPPAKEFQARLLALEKTAFLAGFHKALAFGAGPCSICDQCSDDGSCLFPKKARPSMEASGIDVYQTARQAGMRLKPVAQKGQYIKYIGLLLLE